MALQGGFKVGGLVILACGSGYGNGQYANISLTGGSGGGLKADLTVAFGVAITNAGPRYSDAEYTNVTITSVNSVAAGAIQTIGVANAGADYVNGTYTAVPLSGGSGSNATADVTISGGGITSIVPNNPGSSYSASDPLTVSVNDLGGSKLSTVSIGAGGTGYTDGSYLNVDLVTSSGSSSGAKANVTVASGAVSNVTVANDQGGGYILSD